MLKIKSSVYMICICCQTKRSQLKSNSYSRTMNSIVQNLITRYVRFLTVHQRLRVIQHHIERFLAPRIPTLICSKYFQGKQGLGRKDIPFCGKINPKFICLTRSALYHCLSMYGRNGTLEDEECRRNTSIGNPLNSSKFRQRSPTGYELFSSNK